MNLFCSYPSVEKKQFVAQAIIEVYPNLKDMKSRHEYVSEVIYIYSVVLRLVFFSGAFLTATDVLRALYYM